jgi:hypothetical protein
MREVIRAQCLGHGAAAFIAKPPLESELRHTCGIRWNGSLDQGWGLPGNLRGERGIFRPPPGGIAQYQCQARSWQ